VTNIETQRTEIRASMHIEWDVEIEMDHDVIL